MKKYMSINEAISALNTKKNLKEDFSLSCDDYEDYIIPQEDVEAGVEETYNEIAAESVQQLRTLEIFYDWTDSHWGDNGTTYFKVFYDYKNKQYDLHVLDYDAASILDHHIYYRVHSGRQVADIYRDFIENFIEGGADTLETIQSFIENCNIQNVDAWIENIAENYAIDLEYNTPEIVEHN